ncbi:hypothetical protein HMPREF9419_1081 [Prevotella nigrescens ATCC 33563]|nr:hypothetical protein HMPREF9419_1081 [Prevotella nigrescens ATCC 33563]
MAAYYKCVFLLHFCASQVSYFSFTGAYNKNYSTLMFADIVFGAFKFGRPILLLYLCSNFND